jgi:hypothetical protein
MGAIESAYRATDPTIATGLAIWRADKERWVDQIEAWAAKFGRDPVVERFQFGAAKLLGLDGAPEGSWPTTWRQVRRGGMSWWVPERWTKFGKALSHLRRWWILLMAAIVVLGAAAGRRRRKTCSTSGGRSSA